MEILDLAWMLSYHHIPYEYIIQSMFNTPMICYPNYKNCICSVICNDISYGGKDGLLEIWGLTGIPNENIEGWLTSDQVYAKIYEHWQTVKK